MSVAALFQNALAVTGAAGIYPEARPGTIPVGLSTNGRQIHANKSLADSKDEASGKQMASFLQLTLHPLGVLSDDDHKELSLIGEKASSKELHQKLNNTPATEVDTFAGHIFPGGTDDQGKVSSASVAHTWATMSPAQKGLSLAALQLQNHKFKDGTTLYERKVIPGSESEPELKVGQALQLFSSGVNIYPLTKKWGQYTTLSKLAGGENSAVDVVTFANQTGLLGHGLHGSEVTDKKGDNHHYSGWIFSPQFGPGAILGNKASELPEGYQVVKQSGGDMVAVPKGAAPLSMPAVAGVVGTSGGKGGMSSSAFDVMNSWGDKAHAKNGFGGSQLATGLAKMSKDNPFVFSAAVGSSFYKHLKAVPEDKLQYVSEMGGIALERLTAGKTAKDVDAKGVSLASEIKGNAFQKMAGLRKAFTERGITSKSDAYQLANQGYGEGRFNDIDLVAMHQVFNAVFDPPSMASIQKLVSGKSRVAETIKSLPSGVDVSQPKQKRSTPLTREDAIARNKMRFQ